MTNTYDVCVIGLGLSGLSAAHQLITKQQNVSVCGIEARDRVGGRLLTVTEKSEKTGEEVTGDVGGQWVCDAQKDVMRMVKLLGIDTFKQHFAGKSVLQSSGTQIRYSGIVPYTINWFSLIEMQLMLWKLDSQAAQLNLDAPWDHPNAPEWDSMTALTVINTLWTQTARDLLTAFVVSCFACEPNEISYLFVLFYIKSAGNLHMLIETVDGAQDSKVEGGAQRIPQKLCGRLLEGVGAKTGSSFTMKLSSPVQSIVRKDDIYTITIRGGTQYKCKYIIMAIPPTLQTRIEYSPPLPALRDQLLQHFPMAHCIKTVTTFKSKWWRDLGMAGFFASVNSGKPLTSGFDGTNTHSLVGFIMANNARYWSTKTKQERTEAVLQQYAEMFGRDIEFVKDQFVHFMEQNWANEEFSRGCYEGYTTPGGKYDTIFTNTVALTNYGEAFREPIGNMYFAGTEAAKYWTGYMSGAIDAGERAADDIINDMNGKLRTGPVVRKRSPKKSYVTPVIVALLSMVTFSVIMVLRNK